MLFFRIRLDVNECLLNIHECSENADCLNSAGSYICTCRKDYKGDGRNCRFENGRSEIRVFYKTTKNDPIRHDPIRHCTNKSY